MSSKSGRSETLFGVKRIPKLIDKGRSCRRRVPPSGFQDTRYIHLLNASHSDMFRFDGINQCNKDYLRVVSRNPPPAMDVFRIQTITLIELRFAFAVSADTSHASVCQCQSSKLYAKTDEDLEPSILPQKVHSSCDSKSIMFYGEGPRVYDPWPDQEIYPTRD